jgi:uncharacterized oxidoreductase
MRLRSRKAIITGGSSGIGLAIARELTERGNQVVLVARDAERLCRVQQELPGSAALAADIATPDGRRAILDEAAAHHPETSILINSAGIMRFSEFTNPDPLRGLREQIETNLVALIELCVGFIELLSRRPDSAIVNVSSGVAYVPSSRTAYYSATKAAVHSFTQSLRHQLRGTSIRVIELVPPSVDTPMLAGIERPKIQPYLVAKALLDGLEREKTDIRVGAAAQLYVMGRLFPHRALRKVNQGR